MREDSARDCASALACPVDSTAALCACSSSSSRRDFSASDSSVIFCRSNRPRASCSTRSASCLAEASWELVVISIASCTDFCSESLVRWSTGSTDWMSMEVMTSWFCGKMKRSRTFMLASSPNTEERIILAEFLWKSSNCTPATAPRMREATALQASPTKSGTEKSLADSTGSSLFSTSNLQL